MYFGCLHTASVVQAIKIGQPELEGQWVNELKRDSRDQFTSLRIFKACTIEKPPHKEVLTFEWHCPTRPYPF